MNTFSFKKALLHYVLIVPSLGILIALVPFHQVILYAYTRYCMMQEISVIYNLPQKCGCFLSIDIPTPSLVVEIYSTN